MLVEVTKAEFIEMYEKAEVSEVVVIENKIYGRTSLRSGNLDVASYIAWADLS